MYSIFRFLIISLDTEYTASGQIFIAGCLIVGTAKSIIVVIVMRCFQAFG